MNKIRWVIVGSLVAVLGYSLYLWNNHKQAQERVDDDRIK